VSHHQTAFILSLGLSVASVCAHAETSQSDDSVSTKEFVIQVGRDHFQRIEFEGHDYFMKSARPGSHLVEVFCQAPAGLELKKSAADLKTASRSGSFTKRLTDGCAIKDGVRPARFTFEETVLKPPPKGSLTPGSKPKPFGAHSLPADTDPHVIPEPVDPASAFRDSRF
jgi:hypothetical protein